MLKSRDSSIWLANVLKTRTHDWGKNLSLLYTVQTGYGANGSGDAFPVGKVAGPQNWLVTSSVAAVRMYLECFSLRLILLEGLNISIVTYFVAAGCYAAVGNTGYIAIRFNFVSRAVLFNGFSESFACCHVCWQNWLNQENSLFWWVVGRTSAVWFPADTSFLLRHVQTDSNWLLFCCAMSGDFSCSVVPRFKKGELYSRSHLRVHSLVHY